ncbi:MAG TPA: glycerophosphodiester phosphodiesterase family protein [Streptosporangiaceae bacterium]|nr:glycerophosphodiester phosphodiesterase family protein [Streptosporangiaceae bacterium]
MTTAFLDRPGPLAFAHRGGAAHAPENSWRAFQHAVDQGYEYLETDVQATADGVLIAFHDRTLTRVTGVPGRIARLKYAEIADARIDGTEPIPLMEDLLSAWPTARFNIDVKDAGAIEPLAAVLHRTNAWDRVCVVSFSYTRLRATRRALGRPVCMAASPFGNAVVRFGPRSQGASVGPHRPGGTAPAPPADPARPRAAGAAAPARRMAAWLDRTWMRCTQIPVSVATEPFLARAHALGLPVHVWTVNDRPTMERLLDMGVDGIMTDETQTLREVLQARGQWRPGTVAPAL